MKSPKLYLADTGLLCFLVDFLIHRGGKFELYDAKWTEHPDAADDDEQETFFRVNQSADWNDKQRIQAGEAHGEGKADAKAPGDAKAGDAKAGGKADAKSGAPAPDAKGH